MNHWKKYSLIFLGLMFVMFFFLCRYLGLISTRNFELNVLYAQWNFEEVIDYIDAPYPEDATDIEYESCRFRGNSIFSCSFYVKLEFKAPPDEAMAFAESICDGVLYQAYDPFNSTVPSGNANEQIVLIKDHTKAHYFQSTNTPNTILGNRCVFYYENKYKKDQLIRVDTSSNDLFTVRYEIPIESYFRLPPNQELPVADFINPIENVPFMVVGLKSLDTNTYQLATDQICFEARQDFSSNISTYPPQFIGSSVTISINNIIISEAVISPEWNLVSLYQHDLLATNTTPPEDDSMDDLFHYCYFQEEWEVGTYNMSLTINDQEFQWKFIVVP